MKLFQVVFSGGLVYFKNHIIVSISSPLRLESRMLGPTRAQWRRLGLISGEICLIILALALLASLVGKEQIILYPAGAMGMIGLIAAGFMFVVNRPAIELVATIVISLSAMAGAGLAVTSCGCNAKLHEGKSWAEEFTPRPFFLLYVRSVTALQALDQKDDSGNQYRGT